MVSVPVGTSNSSVSSLFPGATGSAFAWVGGSSIVQNAAGKLTGGSYVAQDTLVNGVGYWIKYDSAATNSITGFLQIEDTIDVVSGWNLIGSISDPVAVSQIASIPGGMVTSQFFGYDSAYQVADSIQPGYAYWVNVNQGGSLILSSLDSIPPASLITIVPDTGLPPPPPDQILGVDDNGQPAKFFLADAYPNPFNPSTTLEFGIVKPGFVSLKIYDVLGREVATLASEYLQPGTYSRTWDASSKTSGIYFYGLTAGSLAMTKKMLLLK